MTDLTLTALYVYRNVVSLGYPVLESFLSTIDMVDEAVICCDPDSDEETLKLVKAICNSSKYGLKTQDVWYKWPIGATGDGSAIGAASQFGLEQIHTTHCINIQADEVYDPILMTTVRDNWRDWANVGYEAFKFRVLHTQHNASTFQGGEQWDGRFDTDVWHRGGLFDPSRGVGGAGYRESFKMIKVRPDTSFLHDAWSFNWGGFKCLKVDESERHPIIHLHDMMRDHYIAMRLNAGQNLWTDQQKYGNYLQDALQIRDTKDEWFGDPKWTQTTSPFMDLLPDVAKPLIGQTAYRVRWEMLNDSYDIRNVYEYQEVEKPT